MGARSGYSLINGVFIGILCFTGTVSWVIRAVPLEAGIGILLWIGIVICGQAFQVTPRFVCGFNNNLWFKSLADSHRKSSSSS